MTREFSLQRNRHRPTPIRNPRRPHCPPTPTPTEVCRPLSLLTGSLRTPFRPPSDPSNVGLENTSKKVKDKLHFSAPGFIFKNT